MFIAPHKSDSGTSGAECCCPRHNVALRWSAKLIHA